jgi:hypothetical protein
MIMMMIMLLCMMLLCIMIFRYYYNKETGVTQWERPVEMGAAPLATGEWCNIVVQ